MADLAMGEPSDRIFHEGRPIEPEPAKAARVAIDRLVLDALGHPLGGALQHDDLRYALRTNKRVVLFYDDQLAGAGSMSGIHCDEGDRTTFDPMIAAIEI